MPYEFYKILHVIGLILLFSGLSSAVGLKMAGVPFQGATKKMAFITHGVGLFFMLVAGFGMMARLGMMAAPTPGWVWAKIGIWLLLGLSISIAKIKGQIGWPLIVLFAGLGATAAWLAVYKPF